MVLSSDRKRLIQACDIIMESIITLYFPPFRLEIKYAELLCKYGDLMLGMHGWKSICET